MLNQNKPFFLYLITLEIPARVLVMKSNLFPLLLHSSPGDTSFEGLVVYCPLFSTCYYFIQYFVNQNKLLLSVVLSVCTRTRKEKFAYSNRHILVFLQTGFKIRKIKLIVKCILQKVVRFKAKKNLWHLKLPRTFKNSGSQRFSLLSASHLTNWKERGFFHQLRIIITVCRTLFSKF